MSVPRPKVISSKRSHEREALLEAIEHRNAAKKRVDDANSALEKATDNRIAAQIALDKLLETRSRF